MKLENQALKKDRDVMDMLSGTGPAERSECFISILISSVRFPISNGSFPGGRLCSSLSYSIESLLIHSVLPRVLVDTVLPSAAVPKTSKLLSSTYCIA
jgi:hypothetical protein